MKNFLMASVIGGLLTVGALAQEPRDKRQQGRIKEGDESGELTNKEAKKLEDRERRTEQKEAKDRVDGGGMTAAERAKKQKRENVDSAKVAKQKHDPQKRN